MGTEFVPKRAEGEEEAAFCNDNQGFAVQKNVCEKLHGLSL